VGFIPQVDQATSHRQRSCRVGASGRNEPMKSIAVSLKIAFQVPGIPMRQLGEAYPAHVPQRSHSGSLVVVLEAIREAREGFLGIVSGSRLPSGKSCIPIMRPRFLS